jgi:hypothetical protein
MTSEFLKIFEKAIMCETDAGICEKMVEGCCFSDFFILFELDYTY